MYSVTKTGLAAEAYEIKGPPFRLVPIARQRYSLLRPEAVESAFVLWRVTRKQEYRDFGWSVFQALEKHSRRKGAGGGGGVVRVESWRFSNFLLLVQLGCGKKTVNFKYYGAVSSRHDDDLGTSHTHDSATSHTHTRVTRLGYGSHIRDMPKTAAPPPLARK